jgi:hypothetical protein
LPARRCTDGRDRELPRRSRTPGRSIAFSTRTTRGSPAGSPGETHPLDAGDEEAARQQLLEWYQQEREKQAANRYQMAIDQDFYDNLQWDEQDIQELAERGQAALVYNVQAATVDWIIGTEKRTRVDFKVFPRNDEDVKAADLKTKTLKYLSDVNKTGFARSLAFADSVKVGVGWLEDGARGDPDEEPLYSRYESWRNIIWDSSGVERNGSDWRYLYRWKWIDLDIALTIWPDRADKLRRRRWRRISSATRTTTTSGTSGSATRPAMPAATSSAGAATSTTRRPSTTAEPGSG